MPLDQNRCKREKYPYPPDSKKTYLLPDDEIRGLFLRIYPSNAKKWVLRYSTADGERRWMTIGRFPQLSIEEARKEARPLLGDADRGADPAAEKKERRKSLTVEELCSKFIEGYAKEHRKLWREDEKRVGRHILNALGSRKAQAITLNEVAKLHSQIGERYRREANQVANLIRRIWTIGIKRGWLPKGTVNPGVGLDRYAETSRKRWLKPAELKRLIEAIEEEAQGAPLPEPDGEPSICQRIFDALKDGPLTTRELAQAVGHPLKRVSILVSDLRRHGRVERIGRASYRALPPAPDPLSPFVRAALLLYCLTGARKNELLRTRWEDVDLDRGELVIRGSKSGDDITLPLARPAVEILRDLPRLVGNPHVFCGQKEGSHLVNIEKVWQRVRIRAGLPDVHLHDLRHSLGAWLATKGTPLLTIQQAMGHRSYRSTLVYAHMDLDPVRAALEEHAQAVMELVNPRPSAEVVQLPNGRSRR